MTAPLFDTESGPDEYHPAGPTRSIPAAEVTAADVAGAYVYARPPGSPQAWPYQWCAVVQYYPPRTGDPFPLVLVVECPEWGTFSYRCAALVPLRGGTA